MPQQQVSPGEVLVFQNVVAASGRDPCAFAVELSAEGLVRVTGPQASACYAVPNWITRFSRQLESGYFDPRMGAAPVRVRTRASARAPARFLEGRQDASPRPGGVRS